MSKQSHSISHIQSIKEDYFSSEFLKSLYFSAEGRINRLTFFAANIYVAFLGVLLGGISLNLINYPLWIVWVLYALFLIVSSVMLTIKRLHDINLSGWMFLLQGIPFLGSLFSLYIYFAPGTKGKNDFGECGRSAGREKQEKVIIIFGILVLLMTPFFLEYAISIINAHFGY
ncbi:hypothetical protein COB57_05130 [Candidatus Peregrinibacteria bacterium]|nr:MAG: hypothetical protein COB57_05130 [Candidatus Peregrinibacteria bacterium]